MIKAKKGDLVKVHYKGTLTSGEQFDSSEGKAPLEFTVGAGQMIAGFDQAIPGMQVGEKKTINIQPGMKLQLRNEAGQPVPVVVSDVKDEVVVLDANHELAGKELIFDIELVEIG